MTNNIAATSSSPSIPIVGTPIGAQSVEQGSNFSNTLALTEASNQRSELTASIASNLMHRAMVTGVPTKEFEAYGGYDAVRSMFDKNGGTYNPNDIPPDQVRQLASEVAKTGVGDLTTLANEHLVLPVAAMQAMADNGIESAHIDGFNTSINIDQSQKAMALTTNPTPQKLESLNPIIASSLMVEAMTTGIASAKLEKFGGLNAVKEVFEASSGSYNLDSITTNEQRQQFAQEVEQSAIGDLSLLTKDSTEFSSALQQKLLSHGVSAINELAPFLDSKSYIDSFCKQV